MKLAQHLMLTSATAMSSTKATSSDKKIKIKNKSHVSCHVNSHVSHHVSIYVTWIYNLWWFLWCLFSLETLGLGGLWDRVHGLNTNLWKLRNIMDDGRLWCFHRIVTRVNRLRVIDDVKINRHGWWFVTFFRWSMTFLSRHVLKDFL